MSLVHVFELRPRKAGEAIRTADLKPHFLSWKGMKADGDGFILDGHIGIQLQHTAATAGMCNQIRVSWEPARVERGREKQIDERAMRFLTWVETELDWISSGAER